MGLIAIPDLRLDTTRRDEVPWGAGVLRLLVPGVAVGIFIDCRCIVDGVEVIRQVISATRDLFSDDEGVEF